MRGTSSKISKNFKEKIYMASKKKQQQQARRAKAEQAQKRIQYAGYAVVLVVVAVIIWIVAPKPSKPSANDGSAACEPFASIAAADQYNEAPPQLIDETKSYFANFKMEKGGEFVVQLYPDKAPITVNSFVFLSCKGFFDGLTFHRVLDGFMAQGGDPQGTGMGGPGYQFVSEISDLKFDKPGVMAMANSGPDTNGSQFFITFDQADFLNGGYTIFGQVTEGMDVVNGITRRDPDTNPTFEGDKIQSVTITME
jgi:cyclophilin family peptidyl-prolyl cis-trans isomerase